LNIAESCTAVKGITWI